MKIAIMQPTYFPWSGYFSLIDHVDKFVFLDNVQFDRRSWQQRNRIANGDKVLWITVPVKKKNLLTQNISDVLINDTKFKKKHLGTIRQSYSQSLYFDEFHNFFDKLLTKEFLKLSDLNIFIIKEICKILKINTSFEIAKNLKSIGKKDQLLANICHELKAKEYVTVEGAKNYIENSQEFKKKNIPINFFNYNQIEYKRGNGKFIPNLSIIDLIFNCGHDTKKLIANDGKK